MSRTSTFNYLPSLTIRGLTANNKLRRTQAFAGSIQHYAAEPGGDERRLARLPIGSSLLRRRRLRRLLAHLLRD